MGMLAVIAACLTCASGTMQGQDPLAGAKERIDKYRKGDVELRLVDAQGKELGGLTVTVRQTRHSFLFGCNIFQLFRNARELEEKYEERFSDLLNYATLAFYWPSFEPKQGSPHTVYARRVAEWCKERGIETKGHPLVWHSAYPDWPPKSPEKAKPFIEKRVRREVTSLAGLVDRWDVVNEATAGARSDNAITAWTKDDGAESMVATCLRWAHEANPKAQLLYNDFNVGPACEKLIEGLQKAKAPIGAIGIQSHMHTGEWPLQRAWDVCETYKRFGLPLHFTELTVLSGEHKTDGDWTTQRTDWLTTPEGEKRQAEYVKRFYTLLFSHPAVEAITWWDFMDGGWLGAPAGLVRKDMSPKPAYEELMKLIKGEWWTDITVKTGPDGAVKFRGFGGDYELVSDRGDATFSVVPRKTNQLTLTLQ
jgi:endo-1,4-beta-xylanase